MGSVRRHLLTALPKVGLSRATRAVANLPLPVGMRAAVYRRFAARYGAKIDEAARPLTEYRSMAAFFARKLKAEARPLPTDPTSWVWPCDGKVVAAGPLTADRLPPIKGTTYALDDLVMSPDLAAELAGGSFAIVYLAPGDYHRVHSPFELEVHGHVHVAGGLYPVNPGAVESIPALFARNEREVLRGKLPDGRAAAVLLVAALNVGDTELTCSIPGTVQTGEELGAFGLGSTVIVLVGPAVEGRKDGIASVPPETVVRCRSAMATGEPNQ